MFFLLPSNRLERLLAGIFKKSKCEYRSILKKASRRRLPTNVHTHIFIFSPFYSKHICRNIITTCMGLVCVQRIADCFFLCKTFPANKNLLAGAVLAHERLLAGTFSDNNFFIINLTSPSPTPNKVTIKGSSTGYLLSLAEKVSRQSLKHGITLLIRHFKDDV